MLYIYIYIFVFVSWMINLLIEIFNFVKVDIYIEMD